MVVNLKPNKNPLKYITEMKSIMKANLTASFFVIVILGTICTFKEIRQSEQANRSLLKENVIALSQGESGQYTGFAKDYEIGRSLYLTSVEGDISADIQIGARWSAGLDSALKGRAVWTLEDEYMMRCCPNMGCYTTCNDIDWRMGIATRGLVRGCR